MIYYKKEAVFTDIRKSTLGRLHPVPAAVYFIAVTLITMFTKNPVLVAVSFAGAMVFMPFMASRRTLLSSLVWYLCAVLLITATNPLFSHMGDTVLFYVFNIKFTSEALLYGMNFALIFISVLTWCRCGSAVLDGDKILYLVGKLAPKTAMIISMTLRYIPLFSEQSKRIKRAQTAMGLYSSDKSSGEIKSGIRVFDSLIGWSLENAVETSNSMRARGYGSGRRGSYERYRFSRADALYLTLTLLFAGAAFAGLAFGGAEYEFYPTADKIPLEAADIISYVSFAALAVMPAISEISERIKWKYYESKI